MEYILYKYVCVRVRVCVCVRRKQLLEQSAYTYTQHSATVMTHPSLYTLHVRVHVVPTHVSTRNARHRRWRNVPSWTAVAKTPSATWRISGSKTKKMKIPRRIITAIQKKATAMSGKLFLSPRDPPPLLVVSPLRNLVRTKANSCIYITTSTSIHVHMIHVCMYY